MQNLPDLGEDPLRTAQHLPGTASARFSARSHIRGGEENETLIVLDGLPLVDPFHVRDYNNIFSTVDQRAISEIIEAHGLDVEQIVGAHGRPGTLQDLRAAIEARLSAALRPDTAGLGQARRNCMPSAMQHYEVRLHVNRDSLKTPATCIWPVCSRTRQCLRKWCGQSNELAPARRAA